MIRRSFRFHNFLQNVAVAAAALVVDTDDGVRVTSLDASSHNPIHPIQHLRVAALHGVEIQRLVAVRSDARRCGAAAHAYAVGRTADLGHEHTPLGLVFQAMSGVEPTRAGREHDRLEPLHSFTRAVVGQAQASTVAQHERLAELVTIITSAVGRVLEDGRWRREVAWVR